MVGTTIVGMASVPSRSLSSHHTIYTPRNAMAEMASAEGSRPGLARSTATSSAIPCCNAASAASMSASLPIASTGYLGPTTTQAGPGVWDCQR